MSFLPSIVTVEPAAEPISLAEAKAQCRIDDTASDTELAIYIKAARQHVEAYTGLALVTQTRVLRARCFADLMRLAVAPVQSITSVSYLDSAGVEGTVSTDIYEAVLIGLEPSIRLKINQSWPSVRPVADAVRVTAVCGYGDAEDVPAPIRQAMLLTVASFMENREAGDMPMGAVSLLTNFRTF